MTATHTRPEERPDWQRVPEEAMRIEAAYQQMRNRGHYHVASLEHGVETADEWRYRRLAAIKPRIRVPAVSRPHPWPQSKQQAPADDFTTRMVEEAQ